MRALGAADMRSPNMRAKAQNDLAYAQQQRWRSESGSPFHALAEAAVAKPERIQAIVASAI